MRRILGQVGEKPGVQAGQSNDAHGESTPLASFEIFNLLAFLQERLTFLYRTEFSHLESIDREMVGCDKTEVSLERGMEVFLGFKVIGG